AEIFSLSIFFSTQSAPVKNGVTQQCSLSRVFDERVKNRALDRCAPLNASEPSRVFAKTEFVSKENKPWRTLPREKTLTAALRHRLLGLPEIYYAKAIPTRDAVSRIDHAEYFFARLAQQSATAEIARSTPKNSITFRCLLLNLPRC